MTAHPPAARRAVALAAAVVLAVVAALAVATSSAVADSGPAAQTRVAASDQAPVAGVGAEPGVWAGGGRGITTPQPLMAVGSCVAPQTTPDDCDSVTLYRAVEPPELEQIVSDGYVYGLVDWGAEGKYFFPTAQQAADFARMNPARVYTLTSSEFPTSIFTDPEVWVDSIGGEGEAIFLPEKYFPHGPVQVHGRIP